MTSTTQTPEGAALLRAGYTQQEDGWTSPQGERLTAPDALEELGLVGWADSLRRKECGGVDKFYNGSYWDPSTI